MGEEEWLGGFDSSGWALPVYSGGGSSDNPNPLINSPQVSPLKKLTYRCNDAAHLDRCEKMGSVTSRGCVCDPFGWVIKCAKYEGCKGKLLHTYINIYYCIFQHLQRKNPIKSFIVY
eukprot:TRINITY_DN15010_c0_g1_i5.p1 TRINITY_DN15010_c0_g1~~TRINITY_DN15010_c0_g1_i5.p1  ORF type:complete len:117 (+),score=10.90 TRINITY_DN15010_c0_g1_i5:4155-4505(+)